MRLALYTWQINSVMKPNIHISGTQMEKKLTDIKVVQKAHTVQLIVCMTIQN